MAEHRVGEGCYYQHRDIPQALATKARRVQPDLCRLLGMRAGRAAPLNKS